MSEALSISSEEERLTFASFEATTFWSSRLDQAQDSLHMSRRRQPRTLKEFSSIGTSQTWNPSSITRALPQKPSLEPPLSEEAYVLPKSPFVPSYQTDSFFDDPAPRIRSRKSSVRHPHHPLRFHPHSSSVPSQSTTRCLSRCSRPRQDRSSRR